MTSEIFSEQEKADQDESAFLLSPSFEIEKDLISKGYRIIAGVDEAGRGSLAGPLSLGLTIYSADFINNPDGIFLSSVNDSKKLTPSKRSKALDIIRQHAVLSTSAMVSHHIIDRLNINGATEFALIRILRGISIKPDIVIMDGNFKFNIGVPYMAVKKGDRRSLTIASASITAKVSRDRLMEELHTYYPGYGFNINKGYGTRLHCEQLTVLGPSPVHRCSYEPVKSMISEERSLFDQ